MKKEFPQRALFLSLSVLFSLMLAGCALMPSQASSTPNITPLALSPTTQGASTPTTGTQTNASDWTTYHQNNTRAGFVANAPDPQRLTRAWSKQLDGSVYAEPLVVGGHVIVATENDSLYAFDSQSGQQIWHTNVGTPVAQSTLPCGDIDPLGITGTPVYDPATGLIFAVAEIQGPAHMLVGVDATTGKVKVRRSADISAMDPRANQQRAALALGNGMVYVAYGGLDGDCSDYIGTVVASRTDGSGPLLSYQVPTPREGGIWAPSGPALDSNGNVFVAVGNGEKTSGSWDHSDSVLRLSPTLHLEDGFAPIHWPQENADDADLGSMGPILLPGGWVYADGKSGLGYLLKASNLGGVGGQVQVMSVCRAFGGSAANDSQVFVPCTSGLRELRLANGHLTLGWHAPSNVEGSPIIGGHTVYALDVQGVLYALNSATGAVRTTLSIGTTNRFATPTLAGNMLFVGTLSGLVAVNIA